MSMLKNLRRCLLLLCVFGVFGGAALVSAQEPIPVIIDSDMNSDDWMAILYLLNDPGYSVKAITVVGTGFTYCDAGIRTGLGLNAEINTAIEMPDIRERLLAADNLPATADRASFVRHIAQEWQNNRRLKDAGIRME